MEKEPEVRDVPGGTLADEAIVARVRAGEVELFELLMRRHNQRAYRAARAILRDGPDLEDVLQQAWLSAYLHLDAFEGRSRFSTWLHRIVQNAARSRARRPAWLVAVGDAPEAADPTLDRDDPESRLLARERASALEHAVDALPAAHRRVFLLREVEGLSTEETAECLGVRQGVVKMRLHRARARLRERLGPDALEATGPIFGFAGDRCDGLVARVMARVRSPGTGAARPPGPR